MTLPDLLLACDQHGIDYAPGSHKDEPGAFLRWNPSKIGELKDRQNGDYAVNVQP